MFHWNCFNFKICRSNSQWIPSDQDWVHSCQFSLKCKGWVQLRWPSVGLHSHTTLPIGAHIRCCHLESAKHKRHWCKHLQWEPTQKLAKTTLKQLHLLNRKNRSKAFKNWVRFHEKKLVQVILVPVKVCLFIICTLFDNLECSHMCLDGTFYWHVNLITTGHQLMG